MVTGFTIGTGGKATAALAWKEWRQQRPLVLVALLAALGMPLLAFISPLSDFRFDSLTQVLLALQLVVIVPVFAAATGALSFADDRMDNTMGFLLSRPVSRTQVWAVKIGVAVGAFLTIVIVSLGISMLLGAVVGGPLLEELVPTNMPDGMRPLGGDGTRGFVVTAWSQASGLSNVMGFFAFNATGPGFILLLFGASVFWSTRSKRPLHAMLAGILTAAAVEFLLVVVAVAELQATGRLSLFPGSALLVFTALLLASLLSFRASDPATT